VEVDVSRGAGGRLCGALAAGRGHLG